MKPRKKGKKFEISYRCPGYSKPVSERFDTLEEANLRIAEIELEKSRGDLRPPVVMPLPKEQAPVKKKFITVAELMDEYVQLYGLNHWSESTLSYSQHRIDDYIKPYIGRVLIQDLTTHSLDVFYNALLDEPAILLKGHKNQEATISPSVISKVHALLRSALNQAVAWGYIPSNPAMRCSLPKYVPEERKVWTPEEAYNAIQLCDDMALKTSMLLAVGCSARIGEILGLTWDCVDICPEHIEDGTARLCINKEIKRCDKSSLEKLRKRENCQVFFTFPEQKAECKTSLVLKEPKSKSSVRTVYLPRTIAEHLVEVRAEQEKRKKLLGGEYRDYDLVVAQDDGRPYEERLIAKELRVLIEKNELTPVVFHSLRHCSTSLKLKLSGGDIKTVQADTGHAQARMVTEVYAHTHDEQRRMLAQKVDAQFFQGQGKPAHNGRKENEKAATDETMAKVYQLLQSNPDLASLLLAVKDSAS